MRIPSEDNIHNLPNIVKSWMTSVACRFSSLSHLTFEGENYEMSNNYEKNMNIREMEIKKNESESNKNKELIEATTLGDLAEDRIKRILQSNETLQGAALWVAESLDKSNGARLLKNAGIIDENLGEKYIDKITSPERPFQKMSGIK